MGVCNFLELEYPYSLYPFVFTLCLAPAQALKLIYLNMLSHLHTYTQINTQATQKSKLAGWCV